MVQCSAENCKELVSLPFTCKYCGGKFCGIHRLPEKHNCSYFIQRDIEKLKRTPELYMLPGEEVPYRPLYKNELYPNQNPPNRFRGKRNRSNRYHVRSQRTPFINPTNAFPITTFLMIMQLLVFMVNIITWDSILTLNIYSLFINGYVHTIFTAMFSSGDFWSFIYAEITLYFIARKLEFKFGSKFQISFYLITGFCLEVLILTFQLSGTFIPVISFLNEGYASVSDGIMLAFITFSIFYYGVDHEYSFYIYFIPIHLRGRHILIILVIFDLYFALTHWVFGSPSAVESIATCFGFIIGYLFYRYLRINRIKYPVIY